MGKSRNNNRQREEYLKGEIRRLKKQVKNLEKTAHIYENAILGEDDIEIEERQAKKTCTSCGKGKLTIFELLGRIFESCELCGERKKIN